MGIQFDRIKNKILIGAIAMVSRVFSKLHSVSPGQDRAIPGPTEAAQSTKSTGDLLRRFKEMGQSVRNDYREPPVLSDTEVHLRVSPRI